MNAVARRILVVGVDFSRTSERALDRALEEACRRGGAELHVATVVDPDDPLLVYGGEAADATTGEVRHTLDQLVARRLARLQETHAHETPAALVIHVLLGRPAPRLVELAKDLGADLLVVGTDGRRGLERALLGSVAELVVRTAPCDVLVARERHV